MTAEYLSKVGSALVRRCGTRDPFKIAKELGIEVLFCEDFGPLKGMYRVVKRNRFIFINQDMIVDSNRQFLLHERCICFCRAAVYSLRWRKILTVTVIYSYTEVKQC